MRIIADESGWEIHRCPDSCVWRHWEFIRGSGRLYNHNSALSRNPNKLPDNQNHSTMLKSVLSLLLFPSILNQPTDGSYLLVTSTIDPETTRVELKNVFGRSLVGNIQKSGQFIVQCNDNCDKEVAALKGKPFFSEIVNAEELERRRAER